jgi:hypothetical protein
MSSVSPIVVGGNRKHAIETTEMLDFLKEIVEGVADPSAGGTIDLDGENGEGGKKKRGKGRKPAPSDGAGTSSAPPAPTMGDQPPKKKRRKKGEAQAGSKATGPSKPSRSFKTEAITEGDREQETEERSDVDQKMEDADEYEDDGHSGRGRSSRRSEAESEWRDEEEDAPYMPRS